MLQSMELKRIRPQLRDWTTFCFFSYPYSTDVDMGLFPVCGSCNSHSAAGKSFPQGTHTNISCLDCAPGGGVAGSEGTLPGISIVCVSRLGWGRLMAGETRLQVCLWGCLQKTLALKSANSADSSHQRGLNETGRWRWVSRLCVRAGPPPPALRH